MFLKIIYSEKNDELIHQIEKLDWIVWFFRDNVPFISIWYLF